MVLRTLIVCGLLALTGCAPPADETPADSDETAETTELTRRQKDSLIADMPVPGAGAVGNALDALGATQRRAEAHDTIS
ncbi:MAG: hypothetical protein ACR2QM_20765 [Longimicrobiales bacterium]